MLAIVSGSFWLSLPWITLALIGITSARAIFWTIPTRLLTGLAAAGGLAFINSIRNAWKLRGSVRGRVAERHDWIVFRRPDGDGVTAGACHHHVVFAELVVERE